MLREHSEVDEALAELDILLESAENSPTGAVSVQGLRAAHRGLDRCLHGQIYEENQILFRRVSQALQAREAGG